ncbi:hypothetical protein SAMN02927937_00149 [Paenimyroides aquimaris]|uniref:Uncharacterized protein n=1 Tax=Paenimyroides marinum TaxID=1159016 RepID=A0A1H6J7R8_9FLAO|nr:hypothetical protein SAMN02927937_00149 [Paenimyroides aquimaris]
MRKEIKNTLSVVAFGITAFLVVKLILKAINTQMDLKNPIIPQDLMYNILFQDIVKVIALLCIFLFQLKLFKKEQYTVSILLLLLSFIIYRLGYFFL